MRKFLIAFFALTMFVNLVPSAYATPQFLLNHTTNWVQKCGFPVTHTTLRVLDTEAESVAYLGNGEVPGATSGKDGITFYVSTAESIRSLAKRYGKRGRLSEDQVDVAETLLHEILHRVRQSDWYSPARDHVVLGHTMGWWEEAIVDAVALDLLPLYTASLYGHRTRNVDSYMALDYRARVKIVRQMSTLATMSPNYRTKAARSWRYRLLRASYPNRARMLEEAHRMRHREP